jgi:hypothetical protein
MTKAISFLTFLLLLISLPSCNLNPDELESMPRGKFNIVFEFPEAEDYPDITLPEKEKYSWVLTSVSSGWGYSFDYSEFENPLEIEIGDYDLQIISPPVKENGNKETRMYGSSIFTVSSTKVITVTVKIEPKEFDKSTMTPSNP